MEQNKLNELNKIVEECLSQHKGGEKFFDHLDKEIQKEPIINELINMIDNENIIVSGKFGIFFNNYIKSFCSNYNVIVVKGGLRVGKEIDNLSYLKEQICDKEFLFIDDSFYSGITRNVIKTELERLGGKLTKTLVVYDGNKKKDHTVKSLYRYYDNFKEEN
jgi:hypothetical protein